MLDNLLELFERDKKPSLQPLNDPVLRGRLASALERRDRGTTIVGMTTERRFVTGSTATTTIAMTTTGQSNRRKKREFDFLDFGD